MIEKRCGPGCESYVGTNSCNADFETEISIQKGSLCFWQYSKEQIKKDNERMRKICTLFSIDERALRDDYYEVLKELSSLEPLP